jgi:hypothetical protein
MRRGNEPPGEEGRSYSVRFTTGSEQGRIRKALLAVQGVDGVMCAAGMLQPVLSLNIC